MQRVNDELTNEQVNAMLSPGLSIEGFEAFMKAKHGKRKPTREQWLAEHKDCAHCKWDGNCNSQSYGYYQPKGIVIEDGYKISVVHGPHINIMLKPKTGSNRPCCVWNYETSTALYAMVDELVKKGEVI